MTQSVKLKSTIKKNDLFKSLRLKLDCIRPTLCYATVIVPAEVVDSVYHQAALSQQRFAQPLGFNKGNAPLEYIKERFQENLLEHVKEFLFKFCVINFLYNQVRLKKLLVAGDPRLMKIKLSPQHDAEFSFELSIFHHLPIYEWKYFPFKSPKRKNYKDLDRQVESFIKEEKNELEIICDNCISTGDWVNFDITLLGDDESDVLDFYQNFWFKVGRDETEGPLREIFIGRKKDDELITHNKELQWYFSDFLQTDYTFKIIIKDTLDNRYFSLDEFKRHFRIKTNKDMHNKMIEVFSYRNDLSQRRSMVEESLKLLLSKHRFSVPNHLIIREQKIILNAIKLNPDYNVYRVQKDFRHRVRQLAEKQAKEQILIDRLAYHENIQISNHDIKSYLNLMTRPRMKEFIYFRLPSFKIQGQEVPIATEEIKRTCLREKTINHIIYHLTKK